MGPFGYLVVASSLHDPATLDRITAELREQLDALGGTRVEEPGELRDEPLAVLVATGGTEAAVLDLVERRRQALPFEPALLVAHPLHNSLPAALESLALLGRIGVPGRIVQMTAVRSVTEAIADIATIHTLHRTRLGLVGEPSPWLVASTPDAAALRERWGVELVPIAIAATIDAHRRTTDAAASEVAASFATSGSPSAELLDAARLHPALVEAIEQASVDAITVRCFDYLGALGTSGCVALARLNDAGVVAGCEGDVASAVAMLLVRALLDQPSWIANPATVDVERDRVLLAHCTVAPSMVEHVELHTHFESGIGVGLRGRFAPGPVTLLRLGGPALEQHWVAEGTIESGGDADDLCRTQVLVRLERPTGAAAALLDAPLGNHLVMFHGHHRDRIERWLDLAVEPGTPAWKPPPR